MRLVQGTPRDLRVFASNMIAQILVVLRYDVFRDFSFFQKTDFDKFTRLQILNLVVG